MALGITQRLPAFSSWGAVALQRHAGKIWAVVISADRKRAAAVPLAGDMEGIPNHPRAICATVLCKPVGVPFAIEVDGDSLTITKDGKRVASGDAFPGSFPFWEVVASGEFEVAREGDAVLLATPANRQPAG